MSKIYVGQLSDQTSEDTLRHVFGEYGGIKHVEMRTGFAFITFDSDDLDLERLINEMNDKELDGNRIRVEKERGTTEGGYRGFDGRMKPPKRLDLRVLIRGLHPKVDWKDLKDWARDAVGEVTYSNVFDRDGQHMGLIELKDEASLDKALATLGDKPLLGVSVTVERDSVDSEYSRIPPASAVPPGHFRGHHNHHNHHHHHHNNHNNNNHFRERRDFYPPHSGRDFRGSYNDAPAPYGRPGDHAPPAYHRGDRGGGGDRGGAPYPFARDHSRDRDFRERDRERDRERERDYGRDRDRDSRDFRSFPPPPSARGGDFRGGDFRGGAPPEMMRGGDDRFFNSSNSNNSSRFNPHPRDLPPPSLPHHHPRGGDNFARGYNVRRSRSRSRSRDRFNHPPPAGNRR